MNQSASKEPGGRPGAREPRPREHLFRHRDQGALAPVEGLTGITGSSASRRRGVQKDKATIAHAGGLDRSSGEHVFLKRSGGVDRAAQQQARCSASTQTPPHTPPKHHRLTLQSNATWRPACTAPPKHHRLRLHPNTTAWRSTQTPPGALHVPLHPNTTASYSTQTPPPDSLHIPLHPNTTICGTVSSCFRLVSWM